MEIKKLLEKKKLTKEEKLEVINNPKITSGEIRDLLRKIIEEMD